MQVTSSVNVELLLQDDGKGSKELKRLQFYGAGPKMAGFDKASPEDSGKTRGKKVDYSDTDPVSYTLQLCPL